MKNNSAKKIIENTNKVMVNESELLSKGADWLGKNIAEPITSRAGELWDKGLSGGTKDFLDKGFSGNPGAVSDDIFTKLGKLKSGKVLPSVPGSISGNAGINPNNGEMLRNVLGSVNNNVIQPPLAAAGAVMGGAKDYLGNKSYKYSPIISRKLKNIAHEPGDFLFREKSKPIQLSPNEPQIPPEYYSRLMNSKVKYDSGERGKIVDMWRNADMSKNIQRPDGAPRNSTNAYENFDSPEEAKAQFVQDLNRIDRGIRNNPGISKWKVGLGGPALVGLGGAGAYAMQPDPNVKKMKQAGGETPAEADEPLSKPQTLGAGLKTLGGAVLGGANLIKNAVEVPLEKGIDTYRTFISNAQLKKQFESLDSFSDPKSPNYNIDKYNKELAAADPTTKAKYFMHKTGNIASTGINDVLNASPAVKGGIAAGAAGVGALGAYKLYKDMKLNNAKVYGCDSITDPSDNIKCQIMVATDSLNEFKKYLSKCYDSNNPESCVKIYSQKIKETEDQIAQLKAKQNAPQNNNQNPTIPPTQGY